MVVLLLALPASRGDEPKKDMTPKEQFAALQKEFNDARAKALKEVQAASGSEREKLIEKYYALGKELADKFYKLAEEHASDPVAADALVWVVQNAAGSSVYDKALDTLLAKHPDNPAMERVCMMLANPRGNSAPAEKALKQIAEKSTKSNVKAAATLGLAKIVGGRVDDLGDKPAEA